MNYNQVKAELSELTTMILSWWENAQYETTGPWGEYNVYDDEPDFVKKAKELDELFNRKS